MNCSTLALAGSMPPKCPNSFCGEWHYVFLRIDQYSLQPDDSSTIGQTARLDLFGECTLRDSFHYLVPTIKSDLNASLKPKLPSLHAG